jgi:hypothetical protein
MARKAPVEVEEETPKRAGKPRPEMPVNSFDAQMAKLAARQQHAESKSAGGNTISTKGGHFTIGGNLIKGDKIRVVCVEAVWFNAFYEEPFDDQNPQPPDCYAFGVPNDDGDDPGMVPHEEAENKQVEEGEMCADCPLNEWATASTGRGKACKNQRRVMLILEDDLGDKKAPFYMLNISVTSVRAWSTYATQISSSEGLPTCGVLTEITIAPVPGKTYAGMSFAFERELEQKEVAFIIPRIGEAVKQMTQPFPKREDVPTLKRGRGAVAKKKISKAAPEPPANVGRASKKAAPAARKFARR